jgi:nucleoid-associated protein YgaU
MFTSMSCGVVDTQDIVEIAETKSKEVVQHKGKDVLGKEKKGGPLLFKKKSDVIDVHTGDTLWGISRKYGVSLFIKFFLLFKLSLRFSREIPALG